MKLWSLPHIFVPYSMIYRMVAAFPRYGTSALGLCAQTSLGITNKDVQYHRATVTGRDIMKAPLRWVVFWFAPLGRGVWRHSHPLGANRGYTKLH